MFNFFKKKKTGNYTEYLTDDEKRLSISELAEKFSKEQNLTYEPTPLTTSCEQLDQRLGQRPKPRSVTVGGGVGVGISTGSGSPVITGNPSDKFNLLDKDTNEIMRDFCACQRGLFVHPFNSKIHVFEETGKKLKREEWEKNLVDRTLAQRKNEKKENSDDKVFDGFSDI